MRLAILSDIHANLEALTAVLKDAELQKVEKIICLGDVVGYGSQPGECVELIAEKCAVTLMGNHEAAALELLSTETYNDDARVSAEWTRDRLSDKHLKMIANYSYTETLADLRFVHSSPYEPNRWHYILHEGQAMLAFENFEERICFFGHSHLPSIFAKRPDGTVRYQVGHNFMPGDDSRYLVNVGSAGQPRDLDPRACYVIYDIDENNESEVEYRRVDYDIDQAQTKMKEANLPTMLYERLAVGK